MHFWTIFSPSFVCIARAVFLLYYHRVRENVNRRQGSILCVTGVNSFYMHHRFDVRLAVEWFQSTENTIDSVLNSMKMYPKDRLTSLLTSKV